MWTKDLNIQIIVFFEVIQANKLLLSHSRKGTPYDNAVRESFYKSLKRKVLNKHGFKTNSETALQLVDYLENYYNVKEYILVWLQNTRRISTFTKLTYLFVHKSLAIPSRHRSQRSKIMTTNYTCKYYGSPLTEPLSCDFCQIVFSLSDICQNHLHQSQIPEEIPMLETENEVLRKNTVDFPQEKTVSLYYLLKIAHKVKDKDFQANNKEKYQVLIKKFMYMKT